VNLTLTVRAALNQLKFYTAAIHSWTMISSLSAKNWDKEHTAMFTKYMTKQNLKDQWQSRE
jgi:hypothetical protein